MAVAFVSAVFSGLVPQEPGRRILERAPAPLENPLKKLVPTAGDSRAPTAAPGSGRHAVGLRVPNRLPNGKPVRFANAGRDADADGGLTLGTVTLGGRGALSCG
ncbi:MAG: hypothetical protein ACK44W_05210 [Planctomycetota bacterium]